MKRSNVSIFVPFAGCPNRCSFCDQHSITGVAKKTTAEDVKTTIETALHSGGIDSKSSEIAFFGGSFTAIDRDYMLSLLEATREYINLFKGIRISTRPDCINDEVLNLLKDFGVTAIELGAQSMCDDVLKLNDRGHNAAAVTEASTLIKEHGFSLGLQMMTGLYRSDFDKDIFTANEFIKLAPDTVRIYPTVIFKNTKLETLVNLGVYNPYTLDDSVELCSGLITMFENEGISVIRVGLHSSETLESQFVAGGYHPAFRELCENRIFLNIILNKLSEQNITEGDIKIYAPFDAISKITGQKKFNLSKLRDLGYNAKVIAQPSLSGRQIIIQEG